MKCFYHPVTNAVALCKSCQRGLCAECAVDVGRGLACRGRCEADVQSLNDLIARNKTSYQKAGTSYSRTALIYALLGALFAGTGALAWKAGGFFLILMGAILLLAALFYFSLSRKYTRPD